MSLEEDGNIFIAGLLQLDSPIDNQIERFNVENTKADGVVEGANPSSSMTDSTSTIREDAHPNDLPNSIQLTDNELHRFIKHSQRPYFCLLPGEILVKSGHCQLGRIYFTDYRLVILSSYQVANLFSSTKRIYKRAHSLSTSFGDKILLNANEKQFASFPLNSTTLIPQTKPLYAVPLRALWNITLVNKVWVHITTKTGQLLKLAYSDEDTCKTWYDFFTEKMSWSLVQLETLFCFSFYEKVNEECFECNLYKQFLISKTHGYDAEEEFRRMGFSEDLWRISKINQQFEVCKSYPQQHIVPSCVAEGNIERMAVFHEKSRFPSVVWRSPFTGSVLLRCAQPLVGLYGYRNADDEYFMKSVLDCVQKDSEKRKKINDGCVNDVSNAGNSMLFVDARNFGSAFWNRFRSGGYVSAQNYTNVKIEWKCLVNIHYVRTFFQNFIQSIQTDSKPSLSLNGCSEWLNCLSLLLKSGYDIVQSLHHDGIPVLVHCTDGWDRTSQLTSLAQLMLDSYYRTIQGFRILIEREWLEFGHKFADRCGFRTNSIQPNETSPIFLQFLDCVYQLMHQFPEQFEFNEYYLLKLGSHVYSGLFGTFLCNSTMERQQRNVDSRTYSIWSFLNPEWNSSILNSLYKSSETILIPSWTPENLVVWRAMYHPLARQIDESSGTQGQSVTPASSSTNPQSHSPIVCDNDDPSPPVGTENCIHCTDESSPRLSYEPVAPSSKDESEHVIQQNSFQAPISSSIMQTVSPSQKTHESPSYQDILLNDDSDMKSMPNYHIHQRSVSLEPSSHEKFDETLTSSRLQLSPTLSMPLIQQTPNKSVSCSSCPASLKSCKELSDGMSVVFKDRSLLFSDNHSHVENDIPTLSSLVWQDLDGLLCMDRQIYWRNFFEVTHSLGANAVEKNCYMSQRNCNRPFSPSPLQGSRENVSFCEVNSQKSSWRASVSPHASEKEARKFSYDCKAASCRLCNVQFVSLSHQYLCIYCGQNFCESCCNTLVHFPDYGHGLVCRSCLQLLPIESQTATGSAFYQSETLQSNGQPHTVQLSELSSSNTLPGSVTSVGAEWAQSAYMLSKSVISVVATNISWYIGRRGAESTGLSAVNSKSDLNK